MEGLYCIFSKNFLKFSGNKNFRKDWNKFPEMFRRKFPDSQPYPSLIDSHTLGETASLLLQATIVIRVIVAWALIAHPFLSLPPLAPYWMIAVPVRP